MPTKKRILLVNDGSQALTGYGTYGMEVLSRLHKTGKYELAELACFTDLETVRANKRLFPWRIYPNTVSEDDPRHSQLHANGDGVFGSWRFDRICLDFKPDIVWDIRDYWMLAYENSSPLRPYFHWAIMPTVDSAPQHETWIETFVEADSIFTYSEWGSEVLREQAANKINLLGVASPGVDLNIFKPYPQKNIHRDNMGIKGEVNILGTVMRNQKRKLYPDLFETFAKFITHCLNNGRKDLAQKTFLYVHSSYPDRGWSFPDLLKKYGVSHKVLFTYVCRACHRYFSAFFQDARTLCPHCHTVAAFMPSTQIGLERKELADIYNLFDAYIQYSICEGFGMPQVEAIACGIPLFAVDYSAMSEVVKKSQGYPVQIQKRFLEIETGAYRVYPDNDHTAKQLFQFFNTPQPIRARKGFLARQAAEKHYNWDNVAKTWEKHFDGIELTGRQGQWDAPPVLHEPPEQMPANHEDWTNEEFVEWVMVNVANEPHKIHSHTASSGLRALNYGMVIDDKGVREFDREQFFRHHKIRAGHRLHAEQARTGILTLLPQDFIEVANE